VRATLKNAALRLRGRAEDLDALDNGPIEALFI
jgi:hypothetical protein